MSNDRTSCTCSTPVVLQGPVPGRFTAMFYIIISTPVTPCVTTWTSKVPNRMVQTLAILESGHCFGHLEGPDMQVHFLLAGARSDSGNSSRCRGHRNVCSASCGCSWLPEVNRCKSRAREGKLRREGIVHTQRLSTLLHGTSRWPHLPCLLPPECKRPRKSSLQHQLGRASLFSESGAILYHPHPPPLLQKLSSV